MSLTSCLMLTIDRYELTRDTLIKNLDNAGTEHLELLVADNGSKDRRIVDFVAGVKQLSYHRLNSQNEGCGRAFNQLYLRSHGSWVALLGNDIELPPGWLTEMKKYADGVPNSGIIGMDWGHSGLPTLTHKGGIWGHWLDAEKDKVFGVWLMRRAVIEKLGLFHEGFFPYGLEDSDFNNRVNKAGFNSVYVPNTAFKSKHVGTAQHDNGDYRRMKDESLQRNLPILNDRCANYYLRGLIEPLPESREPI